MSRDSQRFDQFRRQQRQQRNRRAYEDRVKETLGVAAEALAGPRQQHHVAAVAVAESLAPALFGHGLTRLDDIAKRLADSPDWDRRAVERVVGAVTGGGADHWLQQLSADPDEQRVVERAVTAVTAAAAEQGIVADELRHRVDAVGWTTKIAEHLQQREWTIDDPVELLTTESGALKSLYLGGTGQGKSATLEAEAEEYYRRSQQDGGRDYKILDLMGFRDGENWFYDIPQQDDALRRVRTEMGLPESVAEEDRDTAELEILAPLTPDLPDQPLPYDADADRFDVQPFTIPAAEIRKPLLISMLSTRLTPEKEGILRGIYDDVDRRHDDWGLVDLAEAVDNRDDLSDKKARPIVETLRSLQDLGFVRTRACEHTVDWRATFEDAETVTVFTQAFLDSQIGRLIVFGYLLDTIARHRDAMHAVPECVLLIRELWKVTPHNRRNAFDNRAAELQKTIVKIADKVFRENRKGGLHVLADTQQPSDLSKSVRELFNRYVIFQTDRDTVEKCFHWTASDGAEQCYRTLSGEAGTAAIVGQAGSIVRSSRYDYLSPVQFAGPAHHHRRESIDETGWHARCALLDRELTTPAEQDRGWPATVPDRLRIGDSAGGDEDSGAPDPVEAPVAAFVDRHIVPDRGSLLDKDRLAVAFNEFVEQHGRDRWDFDSRGTATKFGKRFQSEIEVESVRKTDGMHYKGCKLSQSGQRLVDGAMDGLDPAASPITGDD